MKIKKILVFIVFINVIAKITYAQQPVVQSGSFYTTDASDISYAELPKLLAGKPANTQIDAMFFSILTKVVEGGTIFSSTAYSLARFLMIVDIIWLTLMIALGFGEPKKDIIGKAITWGIILIVIISAGYIQQGVMEITNNIAMSAINDTLKEASKTVAETFAIKVGEKGNERIQLKMYPALVELRKDPVKYGAFVSILKNMNSTFTPNVSSEVLVYAFPNPFGRAKIVVNVKQKAIQMLPIGSIYNYTLLMVSPIKEVSKGWKNIGDQIINGFVWFIVMVSITLGIIQYIIAYIEFSLQLALMTIVVPFAANGKTKFIIEKYIGGLITSALKIIVITFVIAVFLHLLYQTGMKEWKSLPDAIMQLVFLSLLFVFAVWQIPQIIQGLLTGSPQMGMHTAVAAAGKVAAGAALAGAGMSLAGGAVKRGIGDAASMGGAAAQAGRTAAAKAAASGAGSAEVARAGRVGAIGGALKDGFNNLGRNLVDVGRFAGKAMTNSLKKDDDPNRGYKAPERHTTADGQDTASAGAKGGADGSQTRGRATGHDGVSNSHDLRAAEKATGMMQLLKARAQAGAQGVQGKHGKPGDVYEQLAKNAGRE